MRRLVLTILAGATIAGFAAPADAFWVARGWRGVAVGGVARPALAREAYFARCWRCAPGAALAGSALAGAALAGTAVAATNAAAPSAAAAPAEPVTATGASAPKQMAQAGGGNPAAAHCAAGLPADSRIIYDASIRNMKSLETLRDTVVAQTRSLVEAGKISEADARPAAEKAGTCLRMLATP
ncbi:MULTISPECIES: hypothetical protein [Methylobacterium]|uniref:hypothetical protein n=1 Tax=Methylobacterium TaxID=407 RepID=UPI00104CB2D7|nr:MULTISPECIES: hypothetical protein [Methylobacterium]MDR7039164.1 hypothetical protein [Methylobacterium sp. BE186]